ncbi:glycosyltransferase family 39 protein, partial [Limnofasciculus baicalensis]
MINPDYLALAGIILLGSLLRFWHLDLKPLWLDEILTAFFSFGQNYNNLPLDIVFPISTVDNIFTFKPEVSCGEIAHNLIIHSTHPPLFFCLIHSWINLIGTYPLAWALRSLPALIGVLEIAAIYCLNRFVFSKSAALMAAALMAVSPFAVYLSQEARHYTLPMLLTTLALLGLIKIQQSLYIERQRPKLLLLLFWGIVNSIGCYVHYFFILVFIAQILTLIAVMYSRKTSPPTPLLQGDASHTPPFPSREGGLGGLGFLLVILVILGVALSYLPWVSVLLQTVRREETDWLPTPQNITPLFQLLVGWILMVIALPVEEQPLWIAIPMGLLMVGFSGWFGWRLWLGFQKLWRRKDWESGDNLGKVDRNNFQTTSSPSIQLATATLSYFTLGVLLQFLGIIYLLGKDISIVPRYNFVYYPAVCALLGASLTLGNRG